MASSMSRSSTLSDDGDEEATRSLSKFQSKSRHTTTSSDYAEAVADLARRTKDKYLNSGSHYDMLARYLSPNLKSSRHQEYGQVSFSHIVLREVTQDRVSTKVYSSHGDPKQFELPCADASDGAAIVFLRGHISSPWLNRVCGEMNIHPEFFRRHLSFLDKNDYFDVPSLPSGSKDILRLRVTTLCVRSSPLKSDDIIQSRRAEEANIADHQLHLYTHGNTGDSVFRRYAVHNETIFTVEQDISCVARSSDNGWTGIVWLDTGRDPYEQSQRPWFIEESQVGSTSLNCLPVIQHPVRSDTPQQAPESDTRSSPYCPRLGQSAGLLALQGGASLDRHSVVSDAMYGFSDIIAFAASSEKQFLNMIRAQIERDLRFYQDFMERSLANISYSKMILDEHLQMTQETTTFLERKSGSQWPRPSDNVVDRSKHQAIIDATLTDLVTDYQCLAKETESLIRRCVEGSGLITNKALLDESLKAAEQNSRIGRLTTLAFLFIPASFVATFFGMNFREFGQGSLRIWVGLVAMAIFVIGSASFCYFDYLSQQWRRYRGLNR